MSIHSQFIDESGGVGVEANSIGGALAKIDSSGITIWIYTSQDWKVEVATPASTSRVVLYQVTVEYTPELLQWGGFIDAYGQVIEKYIRQMS